MCIYICLPRGGEGHAHAYIYMPPAPKVHHAVSGNRVSYVQCKLEIHVIAE